MHSEMQLTQTTTLCLLWTPGEVLNTSLLSVG